MTYTFKETITIGDVADLISLLEEDPTKFQLELSKRIVLIDGQPAGERLMDLPVQELMPIFQNVMTKFNASPK